MHDVSGPRGNEEDMSRLLKQSDSLDHTQAHRAALARPVFNDKCLTLRLTLPQHAGAPLIAPTRIIVAPRTEAPTDAVITVGICLLIEFMMAPADVEEPPQLRAFWSEVGVFHGVLGEVHDMASRMNEL